MFMCGVYGTSHVILRLVRSTTLGHNDVRELPQVVLALAFVQIHNEMGLPHQAQTPVVLVPPAHKQLRHTALAAIASRIAGAHLWASLARAWREVKGHGQQSGTIRTLTLPRLLSLPLLRARFLSLSI